MFWFVENSIVIYSYICKQNSIELSDNFFLNLTTVLDRPIWKRVENLKPQVMKQHLANITRIKKRKSKLV